MVFIFKHLISFMHVSIEEKLARKQTDIIKRMRGLRRPKLNDIFKRKFYIVPRDIVVSNYQRTIPAVIFNPGVTVKEDTVLTFPRLIFDYYKYVSSIGYFEVQISDLVNNTMDKPIYVKILLWPKEIWEFLGCEDARAFSFKDRILILYTGKGYWYKDGKLFRRDVLGFVEFTNSMEMIRKGYFKIVSKSGELIPKSNKDSAFIEINGKEASILTRPEIGGQHICWRAIADIDKLVIFDYSLEPALPTEKWEVKVGWSTNVVKLSSNEYLVGWHGVLRLNLSYANGLAIIDKQGMLLATTNYVLAPKGLQEEYGDRPLVIFGNGLLKSKEKVLWVGGVSDYCIGVFETNLDTIIENMKWIKG